MAPKREPLTMEDREDISRGLAKGLDNKDIAFSIRRDESVVSREIDAARRPGRVPCMESGRGCPRIAKTVRRQGHSQVTLRNGRCSW